MVIDKQTRKKVRNLIEAVEDKPTELPMQEIVDLAEERVSVTVDREGDRPVVFVTPGPAERFDQLSKREFEVATLVAAGFSNGQIADTLFISVATVKDHVHAILAKTELASRSEVAAAWYGRL